MRPTPRLARAVGCCMHSADLQVRRRCRVPDVGAILVRLRQHTSPDTDLRGRCRGLRRALGGVCIVWHCLAALARQASTCVLVRSLMLCSELRLHSSQGGRRRQVGQGRRGDPPVDPSARADDPDTATQPRTPRTPMRHQALTGLGLFSSRRRLPRHIIAHGTSPSPVQRAPRAPPHHRLRRSQCCRAACPCIFCAMRATAPPPLALAAVMVAEKRRRVGEVFKLRARLFTHAH